MINTMKRLIILLLLLLFSEAVAQNSPGIELVSEPLVTGWASDVKIVGSNIFFSNRYGVVIYSFDTDNPEQPPAEVSHFPTPGLSGGLWIEDTLMYLCDDYAGLRIYDISDLSNVVELSVCPDVRGARNVKVRDNLAYVIRSRYGFYIIDVQDPFSPELIGEWRSPGMHMSLEGRSFELKDDLLFCGFGRLSHTLAVFDISNPTNPEFVLEYDGGEFDDFCIVDDVAFFTRSFPRGENRYGSFISLSITDLDDIHVIEQIRGNQQLYVNGPIHFEDGFVYIHGSGVLIFDVRDPENMTLLSRNGRRLPPPDEVPPVVMGDYVFGCAKWHGLFGIDFRDFDEPETIHASLSYGNPLRVLKQDDYLYVVDGISEDFSANRSSQFKIFSIEDINNPVQVAVFDYSDIELSHISVKDNYAFLAPGSSSDRYELMVFNIDDSENPELVATLNCSGRDMVHVDDLLYFGGTGAVLIISVADPANPVTITRFEFGERYDDRYNSYGIAISGDLMYTSGTIPVGEGNSWEPGLSIWDKSDLNNIQFVGECALRIDSARRIALYNNYSYISSSLGGSGISVVDMTDPSNPREVLYMDDIEHATNVEVFDDLLFVLELYIGVKIFSLENPDRPELIGQYDTPSMPKGIDVDLAEGFMYVADNDDISIYDIARFTGLWDVDVSEDNYDYGEVTIDSTIEWELILTNQGDNPVMVGNVTFDNDVFSTGVLDFNGINPDEQASIQVRFSPSEETQYNGVMTIHTNLRNIEVNLSGTGIMKDEVDDSSDNLPLKFAITSIKPNPFNSTTTIEYNLPKSGEVRFSIHDIQGRKIRMLQDGIQKAGYRSVIWNASIQPSGIYFCRLESKGKVATTKLTLMK